IFRFQYDQRVVGRAALAKILWLQGFSDQATRVAEGNIDLAQSLNHELSLCNALSLCGCPIALFVGDLAAAQRYVAMLLDHSAKHALPQWHATGRCFDGVLRIRLGNTAAGLSVLRAGLDDLSESRLVPRYLPFLAELAETLGRTG